MLGFSMPTSALAGTAVGAGSVAIQEHLADKDAKRKRELDNKKKKRERITGIATGSLAASGGALGARAFANSKGYGRAKSNVTVALSTLLHGLAGYGAGKYGTQAIDYALD
jgi:hypothetical protein